jgi:transposase
MDHIVMGKRDARRLGVVQAAVQGRITSREGAEGLGLSVRQFKRLRRQVREREPAGVVHGNRGRRSSRRLAEGVRARVVELLTGVVQLNDHHLAELLSEDGALVSPATVRRVRRELKLPAKRRRRPPRHRRRRERAARRGALVLIDGSPFRWFDEAGPPCTLLGAIDDASGEILALTFRPTEDLHGYTVLLRELVVGHGVPAALYGDRSGVLVRSDDHWTLEEELAGRQRPPQFGRMLEELAVRFIAATSPQAKGRIERLWATLQDRLAAELRLRGHTTVAAASAYLPHFIRRHNQRRGRPPANGTAAFRPAPRDLERILACRYERVVARDNTVSIPGRWAQVPPGPHGRSWHRARVEVRELLDGRLLVLHPRHGLLAEQPAPGHAFVLESRQAPRARRARARGGRPSPRPAPPPRPARRSPQPAGIGALTHIRRPTLDHPWKRYTGPEPLRRRARAGGDRITDALGGQNH